MKKILLLSVVVTLLMTACEKMKKEIDIDISDAEKHIVINGIINPDSLIKVRISQSQNILDSSKINYLTSADVKLYENDVFVDYIQHKDTGVYKSTIKPGIGKEYKIIVDYGNMKTAIATTKLKVANKILKVDTSMLVQQAGYYDVETGKYIEQENAFNYDIKFKVKFKDNGETEDYYFLALAVKQPEYTQDSPPVFIGYKEYAEVFNTNDVVFKDYNQKYTLDGIYGKVFSDEKLNGANYILKFNTTIYDEGWNKKPIIKIKLLTISKDMYQFIIDRFV